MENFRSMSCREGRLQLESYNNGGIGDQQNKTNSTTYPSSMQDLRSFSTSHVSCTSHHPHNSTHSKAKKTNQIQSSNRRCSSSRGGGWSLGDPELQRKKRVASYKVYAVEGKMKGSFRKSFRWIKHTCSQAVYGWW